MAPLIETLQGRSTRTGRMLSVRVRDGLIEDVSSFPLQTDRDIWIAPGLVDLQVNGYAGFDFNVADPREVIGAVTALTLRGTTTIVPTVITGGVMHTRDCLRSVITARQTNLTVATAVAAIHLEGPFISPLDGARGAHDLKHIRPPDLAELQHWLSIAAPLPLFVTLAPEWPGTPDFIRAAVASGVTISLGHSAANPEQINAAIAAGATLSTHLGNGVPLKLPRHPNLLWSQLAATELTAGFIADGFHLDSATLGAMIRAKGPGRSFLVSDSVALAGRPPGRYRTTVGGEVELDDGGRLRVAGQQYLAGAAVDLATGVARLPGLAAVSLGRAVDMATRVPGRILKSAGIGDRGRLPQEGSRADLIRFRWAPGATDLEIL